MQYVFLGLFIIDSLIHLYASIKMNKKLRACTKVFILPLLIGWYCCFVPTPSWLVIVALIASWLGDVLLIPHGIAFFASGGLSFIISHVFFIVIYIKSTAFALVPIWAIIIIALAYIAVTTLVMRGLKEDLKGKLFYALFFYLLVNATMNFFALCLLVSNPCLGTILTFLGATSFFVSDSNLFYTRFKKSDKEKNHFVVMLTYILAEFLIVWGLTMIGW